MILELFFYCFLARFLRKSELLHWEVCVRTVYTVPGMSFDFCGCIWPSISPVHPSVWNICAFSPVCLRCSELLRSQGSGSLYCVDTGGGIPLQIYLLSLRLQQETESVKKANKERTGRWQPRRSDPGLRFRYAAAVRWL